MDNLIADGKIKPFIIVMAYGLTNDIKFGTIGQFTAKEFETLLVDELVPFIDKNFLTKADKWNRAMAGLSMGGVETKLITLRRPEVFGYWGLLSGGMYMPEDWIQCRGSDLRGHRPRVPHLAPLPRKDGPEPLQVRN